MCIRSRSRISIISVLSRCLTISRQMASLSRLFVIPIRCSELSVIRRRALPVISCCKKLLINYVASSNLLIKLYMGHSTIRGFESIEDAAKGKSWSFLIKHIYYDFSPFYVHIHVRASHFIHI